MTGDGSPCSVGTVEQPVPGDELRAIKRHLRERDSKLPWLFRLEHETINGLEFCSLRTKMKFSG